MSVLMSRTWISEVRPSRTLFSSISPTTRNQASPMRMRWPIGLR
jgi:hypothetical protein